MNGADIKLIGDPIDLTYSYDHIGNDRKSLDLLLSDEISNGFSENKSLIVLGQGALFEADGEAVLASVQN